MSAWSTDELRKIAETDDLHISPFREDGKTYGTPTWIWSVVVDDGLYVRPYNGKSSRWYQAALGQKAGRITAAGMTKEVSFEPVYLRERGGGHFSSKESAYRRGRSERVAKRIPSHASQKIRTQSFLGIGKRWATGRIYFSVTAGRSPSQSRHVPSQLDSRGEARCPALTLAASG